MTTTNAALHLVPRELSTSELIQRTQLEIMTCDYWEVGLAWHGRPKSKKMTVSLAINMLRTVLTWQEMLPPEQRVTLQRRAQLLQNAIVEGRNNV